MNPKIKKLVYTVLGAACLLLAAWIGWRGERIPWTYVRAAIIAAIGLYFLLVRGRS